jgi:hypothetical protein
MLLINLHVSSVTSESCLIALACFEHALSVSESFDLNIDSEGLEAMIAFKKLAENIRDLVERSDASDLKAPLDSKRMFKTGGAIENVTVSLPTNGGKLPESTHRQIILQTASAAYELAEREHASGLVTDAARLFHTACIYFRMAEPLTPGTCLHF